MTKPVITSFSILADLMIQQYERYLPTAFDESMSLLEKVNKVIDYLNKTGKLTNDVVTQWNEVMIWVMGEGLNDGISDRLDEMVLDGTLEDIINVAIFNDLNVKIDGKVKKGDLFLNVKDNEAMGDGITDDTTAIQNTINLARDNGGGIVYLPSGKYITSLSLNTYSNVKIMGAGASSIIRKNNGGYVFQALGSIGSEIALTVDKTSAETTITVGVPHGLVKGDLVLLKSQRNAFSSDASIHWRLGTPTSGTNAAYYGEFLTVADTPNNYDFVSATGLFYPYYYKDATRETQAGSRPYATIQKLTPIQNAVVSDLKVEGNIAGALNVEYGKNVVTRNIEGYIEQSGSFIVFRRSFNCHDENSHVVYNANYDPATHFDRNAFKVISSQNCGFDGSQGEYATQTFDFTFEDYSIVTTHPYFKNGGSTFSDLNAGTSHGGVYGAIITGNQFMNCRQFGVSNRARNAIISNNVIQGSRNGTFSYGVAIYEGLACDNIVSNNQIVDFSKGIVHLDGADATKFFGWMGTQMFGNVMRGVNLGFAFEIDPLNTYSGRSGIKIMNNTISTFYGDFGKAVVLSGVHYAVVSHNTFSDPYGNANAGVYISKSGNDNIILENDFNSITPHVWIADDLTGATRMVYDTSRTFTASNINVPATNMTVSKLIYGSQNPVIDNQFSLGWSGGRWTGLYAGAGTINTSDRNYKQQITSIPDTWLNAWQDVEYTKFKFNDAVALKGEDARWHIGLIAQNIDEVFKLHGLDATEIGLLCYDEWINEKGETTSIWSIRPDECQFLEMALMRREIALLKGV